LDTPHDILYTMGETAVKHLAKGNPTATVTEWAGDIYISLTMVSMFTGIWLIGIPTGGSLPFETGDIQAAERELTRLMERMQV